MRIRAIAVNTFAGFLRNRLIILFCALFLCVVLLMMSPILAAKAMSQAAGPEQAQAMVLSLVGAIMGLVSGFGSLLAAWAAADTLGEEIKSGTILAVMARPIRRWEFLLGKYLGVQLLMAVYILAMFLLSNLLAWIGGQQVLSAWWIALVYPLVRYAIYSAVSMLIATRLHPVVTLGLVILIAVMIMITAPGAWLLQGAPQWVSSAVYYVLPSTELLSEDRFLTLTKAALSKTSWGDHLTALVYGLDYALVCFLLATWSFRRRGLVRD